MKRLWIFLIVLLWAGLGLLSMGLTGSSDCPATVSERLVSLAPNLTEILFALGLGEKVVAVSNDSDFPPQAAVLPEVGTFWYPSCESIVAARPQLVVGLSFPQQRSVAERLSRIGYNTLTVKIETIEELFSAIKLIAEATACPAQAEELVTNLRNRIENLTDRLKEQKRVKVLWVVQTEPLRVAGRKTFVNKMIELAGGQNAIARTIHQYPPMGSEQVIISGAEVIIMPAMGLDDLAAQQVELVKFFSKFKDLPAVKEKRIYVIAPDTVSRLSPRLCDGIEMIAGYLHPDIVICEDSGR